MTTGRALAAAVLAAAFVPAPVRAADTPDAILVLEVATPPTLGTVPAAAPRRFVLKGDGQVFAGGTSRLVAGRLSKEEVRALEDRVALVRKLPGLGSAISFGEPATPRYRLQVGKGKPLDLVMTGDPAKASAALAPLVSLSRTSGPSRTRVCGPSSPRTTRSPRRRGRSRGAAGRGSPRDSR